MTELVLRYGGSSTALVEVFEGKEPRADKLIFSGTLDPEASFVVSGRRKDATLGPDVTLRVAGVVNAVFHTDCGAGGPKGSGSASQSIGPGLVRGAFEVLSGRSKDGGLLCPIPTAGNIGDTFCANGAKPRALTLRYTGLDCSATHHSQAAGKVACTGNPAMASPVHILAGDGTTVWFDGLVSLDGSFDVDAATAGATKLGVTTTFQVEDLQHRLLQSLQVHTSCSQPLNRGDQYGTLELLGFTPQ